MPLPYSEGHEVRIRRFRMEEFLRIGVSGFCVKFKRLNKP